MSARADSLAGLLAEGLTITEAARRLGVSQQRASALFALIRKKLGWQAQ